jgi:Flp pilus assembly protein TadG
MRWQLMAASHRHSRRSDESGIVVVWFALCLIVLMAFVGVAIDLSNWWRVANRLQATSDAAALAGVVRMPGDLGEPTNEARRVAAANGFDHSVAPVQVDVAQGRTPAQLKVTTRTTVTNSFLGLLGIKTTNLARTSIAEYQGPVPMGSPENLLGSDPDQAIDKEIWLNIAGQTNPKTAGDRFTSGGSANIEYSENGYFYKVRVTEAAAGRDLVIHAYDPAFVMVDDTCTSNLPTAAQLAALQTTYGANNTHRVPNNPLYPGPMFADASTRYASGSANDFCTGDNTSGASGTNINTVFTVRQPSANLYDPMAGTAIDTASCRSEQTFTPVNGALYPHLNPTNPSYASTTSLYVRQVFRRWVPICRIANAQIGDYVVQIKTPGAAGGHNRFSLRAGFVPTTSNAAPTIGLNRGVQLFANGRLPQYVNAVRSDGTSSTPTFYLAEIPAGSAGRTLTLEFWDIGDVNNGTTNFEVLPPSGSPTCVISPVKSGAVASGCTLSGIASSQYNGELVTATIALPNNYSCSANPNIGCWFRIRMSYSANAQPVDTTTWVARLDGDPIRLVPNT